MATEIVLVAAGAGVARAGPEADAAGPATGPVAGAATAGTAGNSAKAAASAAATRTSVPRARTRRRLDRPVRPARQSGCPASQSGSPASQSALNSSVSSGCGSGGRTVARSAGPGSRGTGLGECGPGDTTHCGGAPCDTAFRACSSARIAAVQSGTLAAGSVLTTGGVPDATPAGGASSRTESASTGAGSRTESAGTGTGSRTESDGTGAGSSRAALSGASGMQPGCGGEARCTAGPADRCRPV